jgi:hypothetical protein
MKTFPRVLVAMISAREGNNGKLKPRLILALGWISLPLFAALVAARAAAGLQWFTYADALAGLWLAIGCYLIARSELETIPEFLRSIQGAFKEPSSYDSFSTRVRSHFDSGHFLLWSIPLSGVAATLEIWAYRATGVLMPAMAGLYYGVVLFVAGYGFWGISALLQMGLWVKDVDLILQPFHSDGFGGLRGFGQLAIRGGTFFFTGALVVPAGIEVISMLNQSHSNLTVLSYSRAEKARLLDVAAGPLTAGFKTLSTDVAHELPEWKSNYLHSLRDYREIFYDHIERIREWPYDFKVFLEIAGSLAIPLVVGLIEIFMTRSR